MRLDKLPSLSFPAESSSFSGEAKAIIEKMAGMTATEKEEMTNALCVSIKHIMVIISQLRGSPLAWKRQNCLCGF